MPKPKNEFDKGYYDPFEPMKWHHWVAMGIHIAGELIVGFVVGYIVWTIIAYCLGVY